MYALMLSVVPRFSASSDSLDLFVTDFATNRTAE